LLPIGDSEYGDDSAATGLAEFNRYYNRKQNTAAAKLSFKMTLDETSKTVAEQYLVTKT